MGLMADYDDTQYADFIQVFEGEDKQWYFRAKSNNGETLFMSEGYTEKSSAMKAAALMADQAAISVEVKGSSE